MHQHMRVFVELTYQVLTHKYIQIFLHMKTLNKVAYYLKKEVQIWVYLYVRECSSRKSL